MESPGKGFKGSRLSGLHAAPARHCSSGSPFQGPRSRVLKFKDTRFQVSTRFQRSSVPAFGFGSQKNEPVSDPEIETQQGSSVHIFRVPRFQSSRVPGLQGSRFQSCRVPGLQGWRIPDSRFPAFQSSRVAGLQSSRVQGFKIPRFQNSRARCQGFRI